MSRKDFRRATVIGSKLFRAFFMPLQSYNGCRILQLLLYGVKTCFCLATEYGSRLFKLPLTPNKNKQKDELRQLTAGQKAVVDAYLENYKPSDYFDPEKHILVDTQQIILEMNSMCNFDENMLCDYLVEKGYQAHYVKDDALSGWILKESD